MTDPRQLFRLDGLPSELGDLLEVEHVWEILDRLDHFAAGVKSDVRGRIHPTAIIGGEVFVSEDAEIGPYAFIEGPAWIGPGASVGHAAYLRGPVVLMAGAVVGHASEIKRSVLLPGARAAHFNYVGDSVLGRDVNLGAGVKVANFKTFGNDISMDGHATGLRKLGAAVGDGVSIGCNAVLSPGTVVGSGSIIYNGALVRGTVQAGTVVKARMQHESAPRRKAG